MWCCGTECAVITVESSLEMHHVSRILANCTFEWLALCLKRHQNKNAELTQKADTFKAISGSRGRGAVCFAAPLVINVRGVRIIGLERTHGELQAQQNNAAKTKCSLQTLLERKKEW